LSCYYNDKDTYFITVVFTAITLKYKLFDKNKSFKDTMFSLLVRLKNTSGT